MITICTMDRDIRILMANTRDQMLTNVQSGKKGKEGDTRIVAGPSGREYAVKVFKSKKSAKKIHQEADLQSAAAKTGAAPMVYGVNEEEKYIVMEKMETLLIEYVRSLPGWKDHDEMPMPLQKQIVGLMLRLDEAKVIQNDGNSLNLMMKRGKVFVIDFGFAKEIKPADLKKRGPHPNFELTLWAFHRNLRHYQIKATYLDEVYQRYMVDRSVPSDIDATSERLTAGASTGESKTATADSSSDDDEPWQDPGDLNDDEFEDVLSQLDTPVRKVVGFHQHVKPAGLAERIIARRDAYLRGLRERKNQEADAKQQRRKLPPVRPPPRKRVDRRRPSYGNLVERIDKRRLKKK